MGLWQVVTIILAIVVFVPAAFAMTGKWAPQASDKYHDLNQIQSGVDLLSVSFPFTDTVYKTAFIGPYTVLKTSDHGLWVVTEESASVVGFKPEWEQAYAYQDGEK